MYCCGKILRGMSCTFWEPAIGTMSQSGGVCITLGSRWTECIRGHGTLVCGRAIWISMQVEHTLIGFMLVYVPNDANA